MMMYQLPIDMMTRMPSVMRATRSPPFQSASRPYGFSTISVVFSPTFGAGATAAGAAALSEVAAAGAAGCCACAATGASAVGKATIRAAASIARRVIFNMFSPR